MNKPAEKEEIMIDIETLGLGIDATIIQIAWARFDSHLAPEQAAAIPVNNALICPKSCADIGLTIDPSTVSWWFDRGAALAQVLDQPKIPIAQALALLAVDASEGRPLIWAQGADFDFPRLSTAFQALGQRLPWHYTRQRCSRTMIMAHSIDKQALAKDLFGDHCIPHNAAWDVRTQIAALQTAREKAGLLIPASA